MIGRWISATIISMLSSGFSTAAEDGFDPPSKARNEIGGIGPIDAIVLALRTD
jgi:hypothetical protein